MLPAQKRSLLSQSRSVELLLPETLMWRGIYQQSGRRRGLGGCDTSPPRLCCKNFEEKAGSERKKSEQKCHFVPSFALFCCILQGGCARNPGGHLKRRANKP